MDPIQPGSAHAASVRLYGYVCYGMESLPRQCPTQLWLTYLYKGSEFGHWRVTAGWDAFAFRHPSLGQTDVRRSLDSEAHHHEVSPIGTGRLIA